MRQPLPDDRRHGRLHDGYPGRHYDRGAVERRGRSGEAAQATARRGEQKSEQKRAQGSEPGNQKRSGQRRNRKQDYRQAGQQPDFRTRKMQIGLDDRNDRRHRQQREAQRGAEQPKQQDHDRELARLHARRIPQRS